MKTVEEGNELFTTGGVHRKFQCRLDCFSAAVGKVSPRRRWHGHNLVEFFRERRHVAVVVVSATHVNELFRLLLNCSHNFRMTVTR